MFSFEHGLAQSWLPSKSSGSKQFPLSNGLVRACFRPKYGFPRLLRTTSALKLVHKASKVSLNNQDGSNNNNKTLSHHNEYRTVHHSITEPKAFCYWIEDDNMTEANVARNAATLRSSHFGLASKKSLCVNVLPGSIHWIPKRYARNSTNDLLCCNL